MLLSELDVRKFLPVGRPQRDDVVPRAPELRLGIGEGYAERFVVEPEERLSGGHALIVVHQNLRDDAGHVGRQIDRLGAHIGILGRNVAAAREIEIGDAEQREDRPQCDQRPAQLVAVQPAAADARVRSA